jgi:predicted enzyme related to lactoylglutathione lyase
MGGMAIRTSRWPAGTPCWADISVPEPDRAKAFYGAVLEWDFSDAGDEFGGYVSAFRRQAAAAGIGPQHQRGTVAWTLYLASDDAGATADAIRSAGGRVIVEPRDVGDLGRMVMAADPAGAAFGVWEAGTHIGSSLVNEPGGMAWEDLRSTDPQAARAFYASVFGFETRNLEMAGADYWTFHHPGDPAPLGGMGAMMGEPAESHWVVYFSVEDTDAAVAAAEAAGGSVTRPAMDTPFGRMAGLIDPFGAPFTVAQNTGQPLPERGD